MITAEKRRKIEKIIIKWFPITSYGESPKWIALVDEIMALEEKPTKTETPMLKAIRERWEKGLI